VIIKIDDKHIDVSRVCVVGELYGKSPWVYYTIVFDSGYTIEVYERKIPRDKFIDLWKTART